jgi:catechol 2,3-dioxygenase-like lactoylglutathione lyase family enzyme
MSRVHLHLSVPDLEQAVRFYSGLFGSRPTVLKPDYAKWSLRDPAVNFAITPSTGAVGVNHLGIEVDSEAELAAVAGRLEAAQAPRMAEPDATCCYARSEKSWSVDPAGVVWETFYTHGESAVYGSAGPASEAFAVGAVCGCVSTETAEVPAEVSAGGCCSSAATACCASGG